MGVKKRSVLFLGKDRTQTSLIAALESKSCAVLTSKNLNRKSFLEFDLIVSFGYKQIIKPEVLKQIKVPIINLHISYLPWNRGADPNFWSFWDNTPSGVSIHHIDTGIDTGPILYQRMLEFDVFKESFESSYKILNYEIEKLFLEKIDAILNHDYEARSQRGKGSIHYKSEFPTTFAGWKQNIYLEVKRLEEEGFRKTNNRLQILDEIENVRSKNNINWMNLLRIVAEESPHKFKQIVTEINKSDNQINELFSKLVSGDEL
jgi:methionyl-tRNA formyltransferase